MDLQSFGGARTESGGRRKRLLATVLLGWFIASGRASAQELVLPTDAEVTSRIEFIQGALDGGAGNANRWWLGWLAAYGAGTAAQAAIAVSTDDGAQRQDMWVGGVTSALGAAGQVVFPLRAGRFATRLREMPEATLEQRRVKLAAAEAFLEKAADEESFGRSWKNHLLSLSINAAAGVVTSVGFDRPATDGLIAFGIGQLVSELQFFTQPMRAVRDFRLYSQRVGGRVAPGHQARVQWSIAVTADRFSVTRSF